MKRAIGILALIAAPVLAVSYSYLVLQTVAYLLGRFAHAH